jgi:hypothetical protein
MAMYQGKQVTIVRPAKQGDAGFDAAKPKQVIRLPDGTEKTVAASELTEQSGQGKQPEAE